MSSDTLRTVLFGLVLTVLLVPGGGPYALPGLAIVWAIVVFDLYRQAQRRDAIARGEIVPPSLSDRAQRYPAWMRVVVFLAVVIGGGLIIAFFAGTWRPF